jgi:hypothetical protein
MRSQRTTAVRATLLAVCCALLLFPALVHASQSTWQVTLTFYNVGSTAYDGGSCGGFNLKSTVFNSGGSAMATTAPPGFGLEIAAGGSTNQVISFMADNYDASGYYANCYIQVGNSSAPWVQIGTTADYQNDNIPVTYSIYVNGGNCTNSAVPPPCMSNIVYTVQNNDVGGHWYFQSAAIGVGNPVYGMLYLPGGQSGNSTASWPCATAGAVKLYLSDDYNNVPSLLVVAGTSNGSWDGIQNEESPLVVPGATPYVSGNSFGNSSLNLVQPPSPDQYNPATAWATGTNSAILWSSATNTDQAGFSALYDAATKASVLAHQDAGLVVAALGSVTNAIDGGFGLNHTDLGTVVGSVGSMNTNLSSLLRSMGTNSGVVGTVSSNVVIGNWPIGYSNMLATIASNTFLMSSSFGTNLDGMVGQSNINVENWPIGYSNLLAEIASNTAPQTGSSNDYDLSGVNTNWATAYSSATATTAPLVNSVGDLAGLQPPDGLDFYNDSSFNVQCSTPLGNFPFTWNFATDVNWSPVFSILKTVITYVLIAGFCAKMLDEIWSGTKAVLATQGQHIQPLQLELLGSGGNFLGIGLLGVQVVVFLAAMAAFETLIITAVTGAFSSVGGVHGAASLLSSNLFASATGAVAQGLSILILVFPLQLCFSLFISWLAFKATKLTVGIPVMTAIRILPQ